MAAYTTAFGLGGQDMYLLLADDEGQYEFGTTFGGTEAEVAHGLELTADGGFVIAGLTDSFGPGPRAMFVVKTGSDGLTEFQSVDDYFDPVGINAHIAGSTVTLGPNPVESGGTVQIPSIQNQAYSFEFFDDLGRAVGSGMIAPDGSVQVPHLANGVYVLHLLGHSQNWGFFRVLVVRDQ